MRILPLCAAGILLFSISVAAQTKPTKPDTRGTAVAEDVRCNVKDDDCDDAGGPNGQSAERIKMEKLKPVEAEPLELLDETDPCPTLPC